MSRSNSHPGLNLGQSHGKTHVAAEGLIFGFWIFMMSDAILFGLLFATYITLVDATVGGPGPQDLFEMRAAFIETLILLTSSLTCSMALVALKHRAPTRALLAWLSATLVLGVVFLGFELHDFANMMTKGGVPQRSGFLSAFWGLVPLHGLHVTAAMIWALALMAQIGFYGVDHQVKLGLLRLGVLWHFLDIVWIGIFSIVYIWGLA